NISDIILKDYVRSLTPSYDGKIRVTLICCFQNQKLQQANQRSITAILSFVMRWKDPRLRWNPADHSNVTEINLPDYVVWLPPFLFYNSVKFKFVQNENARLVRVSERRKGFMIFDLLDLSRWIGVSFFPFDVQNCLLAATTPLLNSDEVVAREGIIGSFVYAFFHGNDEFDINNISLSTGNFTEFGIEKSEIYISIFMTRHSLYYVIVLIVPTALFSFIATAGFFGTNSKECIMNIGFSCLLTISMVLEILSGIVPKS
ncbi:hypothetical protein PENTCL1PPCAC_22143, partial [Pristionchus entomophagus]